jgi:hypothetical protein
MEGGYYSEKRDNGTKRARGLQEELVREVLKW